MAKGKDTHSTGRQQINHTPQSHQEKEALKQMTAFNRQFMETNQAPDLQAITEFMRTITGARYAFLNLLDENRMEVVTEAVAGPSDYLMKISNLLGFQLVGKRWPYDQARHAAIESSNLTTFDNLQDSIGKIIPSSLASLLEKTLNFGQVAIFKINKMDQIMGEFTLIMHGDNTLVNHEMADLFASQVGLFLDRSKNMQDLQNERNRLTEIIQATHVATWEYNVQTGENAYNERWAEMLGYMLSELQPTYAHEWRHMVHPDDLQRALAIFEEAAEKGSMYTVELRLKHKAGHWVWVEDRGKVVSLTEDGKPLIMRGTRTDITERKEMELALAKNEQAYRAYVDKSPLGIFVTDHETRYLRVNPAGCEMTGYTEEELKKMKVVDLLPPELGEKGKVGKGEEKDLGPVSGEYIGLRKNGERYWGNIHIARIDENQLVAFCEDITQRKQVEEKLQEFSLLLEQKNQQLEAALRQAKDANEAKSRYLSHMNHEMRTPLNGFIGFIQLLETTRLDAEQAEFVHNMQRSAGNLLAIINNVLDYAKIEAGEIKLNNRVFCLEDELQTAFAPLRSLAMQKNLHLEITLADNLPRKVLADPDRLRQIILNLGGNAIKFTEKGQVHITIQCEETTQYHHLKLVVEDTGRGMTQETLKKLFRPFYQADDGSVSQSKGTGLGLAITRELVDLMGGDIKINSTPGVGTRVEVNVKLPKTK
ncbi:PAS domain S-box protein [Anoxynatronum buryatiense]|uniref:Circadian input-output histidine kinase CikA n=1 Tax=Anoxynatronum buryatiense TaxID=489973 RepID=A0AA45X0B0_9CLOT|nr:PAS domain S-box protein [Anoxynatronum buryatiense]SMP71380.1 PAS domain S-box-containing protein [Anoxynatronum buryatiense]